MSISRLLSIIRAYVKHMPRVHKRDIRYYLFSLGYDVSQFDCMFDQLISDGFIVLDPYDYVVLRT